MSTPRSHQAVSAHRVSRPVARAMQHVDGHLDTDLTAFTLAHVAAISVHHFHRLFAADLGCSVGTYVTWRRLHRAAALLASGRESVLDVALSVGFESGQALAKAMRREWGTTPTSIRQGHLEPHIANILRNPPWKPGRGHLPKQEIPMVHPTRHAELPPGLNALTATGRGMVNHTMERAAQQAFNELSPAIGRAGLMPRAHSWLAICPDDAQGPDDPDCRYVAGVLFDYAMSHGVGTGSQPDVALTGTLAWQALSAGPYAVFTHIGAYSGLHRVWAAIYRQWLPESGAVLRDVPPLELMLNDPKVTPVDQLHTEIWIPIQTLATT